MTLELIDRDIERYTCNLVLKEIGPAGQRKLFHRKVAVVGLGGLGSVAAYYLAANGVGHLGLIDSDTVELSNLQRQILHSTSRLGQRKVESAGQVLKDLNPAMTYTLHPLRLTPETIDDTLKDYEVIVEGSDNFETKFLVNDWCMRHHKPFTVGGALGFYGQVQTVQPGQGACLRCVLEDIPPLEAGKACTSLGIFAPLLGILGSIQAAEVLKLLLSLPHTLINQVLTVDLKTYAFRTVAVSRRPDCPACAPS